jgi:thymidylate synthase (FAD)
MKIADMQVTYVDHMGTDLSVVNAARVSFHKESDWMEGSDEHGWQILQLQDEKLINYLAKHKHWTPFAHAFISLRVKAPIFVARQLVKHQVGLAWNEVSRRYVDDEPEFWFPKEWRGRPVNAKQGSDGTVDDQGFCTNEAKAYVNGCLNAYEELLERGVAPEQARIILPQNMMTEWIWSGSLAAFVRVCKLRLDPHAQQETQEVAAEIRDIIAPLFPVSFKALMEN